MTASLQLASTDRVLVFAPHPDDETLAAGELIQSARSAGAAVRVVLATDGDNNPWPQRWLERRWRIDAAGRRRWGERRRGEAMAALALLGVDARDVRFLGWPDQGLTDKLMRDDEAVAELAVELAGFAPTHVAMPALADRHPDHSALRVMLELAALHAAPAAIRLGYTVHGRRPATDGLAAIRSTPAQRARKLAAVRAHASQIALGRKRLLELAARPECFDIAAGAVGADAGAGTADARARLYVRHSRRWSSWQRHELLVVVATRSGTERFRFPLPRFGMRASAVAPAVPRGPRPVPERDAGALAVELPVPAESVVAMFAKLDRIGSRLVIFDRDTWQDVHRARAVSAVPAVDPRPVARVA